MTGKAGEQKRKGRNRKKQPRGRHHFAFDIAALQALIAGPGPEETPGRTRGKK